MLLTRLTLDLYFNSQITLTESQSLIGTSYRVIDANDDFISIEHPTDIGIEYNMEIYNQWYVDFIENNHSTLKHNGLDKINIFIRESIPVNIVKIQCVTSYQRLSFIK